MARIAVDLDDTIYPFVDTLRQYLITRHGYTEEQLVPVTRWDIHEQWDMEHSLLWYLVHRGVEDDFIYCIGEPLPGTMEALITLKDAGHSIHLVTARSAPYDDHSFGLMCMHTHTWLRDNNIPYDSITYTQDKSILNVDYAIDDRMENYYAFANAGAETCLMNRPWNQEAVRDGKSRVNNMLEFVKFVQAGEDWNRY